MAGEKKSGKSLGGIVAAAFAAVIGSSGCYMLNGPYVDIRLSAPSTEQRVPVRRVAPPRHYAPQIVREECHVYAKTAADSMDPKGRRHMICSCYNPDFPREKYTCEEAEW